MLRPTPDLLARLGLIIEGRGTLGAPQKARQMLTFLLWLVLLVVCWPLALAALVLYPLIWLLLLPLRLVGIVFTGVFELLRALVLLPARVLGGR
jgi:hypothetical protein